MPFKVYRSSAGSGKTYTLVKEYLKLCLQHAETQTAFRNILALTFTNKATAEMKQRIITSLEGLAAVKWESPVQAMGNDLCTELNLEPSELQKRCQAVFANLLHHYEDFAVLTIDKFTSRVIRSFANDLGLQQDFEIELDSEKILHLAVNRVLDQLGTDAALTAALTDFVLSKAEEDGSHRINQELFDFSRKLLQEENTLRLDYFRNFSIADLMQYKVSFREKVKAISMQGKGIAQGVVDLLKANNIPVEAFAYGDKGFAGFWGKVIEQDGVLAPNKRAVEAVELEKWTAAKEKTHLDAILAIAPQLTAAFNAYLQFLADSYSDYTIYTNALQNFSSLVVINEVEKALLSLKEELNIVLISDFNLKTSRIVATEPAPFIYEKLGHRYQNFLVDEFQDTSVMQWLNLLPLVDESLATDNFSMLVGDAKQAIYRFRGGEVEQFAMLPNIYLSQGLLAQQMEADERKRFHALRLIREQRLKLNIEVNNLVTNRRSKTEVVNFNNCLYGTLQSFLSERNKLIFSDFEQSTPAENTGGFVQIQLIDKKNNSLEIKQEYIHRTIEAIKQCIADGYQANEIAVLTRSKKDGAAVAEELLLQGFKVISADSMMLSSSPKVNLLVALAKAIANKQDRLSVFVAARYLADFMNLSISAVFPVVQQQGLEGLFQLKEKPFAIDYLLGLPLHDFFLELATIFLTEPDVNTQFLFDEALNYSQRFGDHLPKFLTFFDENSDNLKIRSNQDIDAINVMTIHKSKGLEFPVVLFPFATDAIKAKNETIWYDNVNQNPPVILLKMNKNLANTAASVAYETEKDKMILDMVNILYVATTRPRERLYIFTELQSPQKEKEDEKPTLTIVEILNEFCKLNIENQKEDNLFEWGVANIKASKAKPTQIIHPMVKFSPPSVWRKNLIVKASTEQYGLNPKLEDAIQTGRLVHKALSYVFNETDVEKALLILEKSGEIEAKDAEELKKQMLNIVQNPHLKEYFSNKWECINEAEIVLPTGKTLRPDRVVLNENEAIIIDFKTGIPSSKHKRQLTSYGETLSSMGYTVKEKLIFYTETAEVIRVN